MPDHTPIVDLLAALEDVFRGLDVRWYLFGAQAVTVWGRPRMSADVDVTAELDLATVPVFVEVMARAGFELRVHAGVEDFVARTRVLPFLHVATRMRLDVVLAGPGLEEEFLARVQRVDLGGVVVPALPLPPALWLLVVIIASTERRSGHSGRRRTAFPSPGAAPSWCVDRPQYPPWYRVWYLRSS